MGILLGIAILLTLALVASSRRFWKFRRSNLGAALTTGGWMMVATGMLLGPHGMGLIDPVGDPVHNKVAQPMVLFLLGWVGLIVGLGADRRLVQHLPGFLFRLALFDALMSLLIFSGGAWAMLVWLWDLPPATAGVVAVCIGSAAMGWSPDVRSLLGPDVERGPVTRSMRALAGMGSILGVVSYGLLQSVTAAYGENHPIPIEAGDWGRYLAVALLIGLMMGVLGLWLMRLAGNGEAEFLVVLIGLVSLVAGAAVAMGQSALFVALLAAAVMVNLPARALEKLKRVILEAEQPVAMVLMLAAGTMADPAIGWTGAGMILFLFLARLGVKLWLMRRAVHLEMQLTEPARVLTGLVRQNPLGIALGVAFVVTSQPEGERLLMVLIGVGVLAEAWPFLHRWGRLRPGEGVPA